MKQTEVSHNANALPRVKWYQLAPETYRQRFILYTYTIWAFCALSILYNSFDHAHQHRLSLLEGLEAVGAVITLFRYLRLLWKLRHDAQLRERVLSNTPIPVLPKQHTERTDASSLLRPAGPSATHNPEELLKPTEGGSEHLVRGSAPLLNT